MSSACPFCAAPIVVQQRRCDECQLALDWSAGPVRPHHPFIKPGDPLLFLDATRGPLPGREGVAAKLSDGTNYQVTPQGSLVSVSPKRAFETFEPRLRCRDVCVRASFVVVDPLVTVGCLGRIENVGDATLRYMLEVNADKQRFNINRGFSSSQVTQSTNLWPLTPTPIVRPVGQPNVIELRLQGPTLEARINDQHVATLHDPVLGIGAAGICISSNGGAQVMQRVVVQWFEMREVIA